MKNLLELDARLSERLRVAEKPGLRRIVAALLAHSGDSWFWLLGLALVWGFGSPYWRARALAFGVGIAVTAAIVMTIKFTVRRRRPEGEWGSIYRRTDPHSFPSGHAARAAMLSVMGFGLCPLWLGMVLLAWALGVMLARVAMGVHYLSDVVAGGLLGSVIGYLFLLLTGAWV